MEFNTTFNNISVRFLGGGNQRKPRHRHRCAASHWQTWSHNVASSTLRLNRNRTHNVRNWQHVIGYTKRIKTKQKHNTICVGHYYVQTNTNNINMTWALIQTTGGKDEPNIVFMWKS